MGSARFIIGLNHLVTIFILIIGMKKNFTVMVLKCFLTAVHTLVLGLITICRVKDIILHLMVPFIIVISAIMILTDTVHLRMTKANLTPVNVRMMSATDWINSSPPRGVFIKGFFVKVNISVQRLNAIINPWLHIHYSYLKFFHVCYSNSVPESLFVHGTSLVQTPLHPCRGSVLKRIPEHMTGFSI